MSKSEIDMVIVVSDLHCGSSTGLCPPAFVTEEAVIGHTEALAWVWGAWIEFCDWVEQQTKRRNAIVIINGDAIDGNHHRTAQLLHADPGVHVRMAVEALKPMARLVPKDRLFVVRGTEAHTYHSTESGIAGQLGARRIRPERDPALDNWRIRIGRHVVSAKHHITATSRAGLEAGGLGRAMVEEQSEHARNGLPMPTIMLRAHRHRGGYFSDGLGLMLVTPSWQLRTRYGHKVVPDSVEHVGGAVIDLADDNHPHPRLWRRVYPGEHVLDMNQ